MIDFGESQNFLKARMQKGAIVLVLGAGANGGSKNRRKDDIVLGKGLAGILCAEIGEAYNGEPLAEVVTAADHVLGRDAVLKLLVSEFRFCTPSDSLKNLFKFTWKRLYTWNYDDALIEAFKSSVQRIHQYNGMNDSAEEIEGSTELQVVFLHGMISQLQKGIILSDQEYAKALQSGGHQWYKRLAQDYRENTVIFVGTALDEPILAAELERAATLQNGASGKAFVITPDKISSLKTAAFAARDIVHIRGTLDDLVEWLQAEFGTENTPQEILEESGLFSEENIGKFSFDDVAAAQALTPIIPNQLRKAYEAESRERQNARGRYFLNGFPPSWMLASSPIPVKLTQLPDLKHSIQTAFKARVPLFVTVGQAGSGKSTATMQALLELAETGEFDVFELDLSVHSVKDVLNILKRLSERKKIVYLNNLFVFGASLEADFDVAKEANTVFVSTARSSEWKEHFEKHFLGKSEIFRFQRFTKEDYLPLIERLKAYVPAPKFVRLKEEQQIAKLAKSKNQLLIALREATESRNFDEIILDEFNSLANDDVKDLFLIVGLCTLARVGVSEAVAAEAYESSSRAMAFGEAIERLEGIVARASSNRLIARHEFYVRKILDRAIGWEKTFNAIENLLLTFTKYQIPITKHVSRPDAALFRFLLNHSFLRDRAEMSGDKYSGLSIYRRFEIEFQLDGHFWLQYGLYYQRLKDTETAIRMLEKSIEAFPDNPFAIHALATERLRQARNRSSYDQETKRLIDKAVTDLEKLQASTMLKLDQYPIVTLSNEHIDVLIKYKKIDEAKDFAKQYYDRITYLSKIMNSDQIEDSKRRLLKYISTGHWEI